MTQILELMQTKGLEGKLHRQWLSIALAYFHGLPKKVGLSVEDHANLEVVDGGVNIKHNGEFYWVPIFNDDAPD